MKPRALFLLVLLIGIGESQSQQCGTMKAFFSPNQRIVGGEPAASFAWPWQVYITLNGRFTCGGTLIDDIHVLSAAHCIIGQSNLVKDYLVRVGAQNMDSSGYYTGTTYRVAAIYTHERYVSVQYGYDIAILRLANPVRFGDTVNAACLPPIDFEVPPYELLVITGFGLTSEDGGMPFRLLQAVIQELPTCTNAYQEFSRANQVCAGVQGGGRDTCQGDSGGPLVYRPRGSTQWYVVGITSYGNGCARHRYPGVYTKVSAYLRWIKSVVEGS